MLVLRATVELRSPSILSRFINLCWSLFQWCVLLATAAAVLVGAYLYLRLDNEIRRQVERRLAEQYPNLRVHVGRARFDQDRGIAIYDVAIGDGNPSADPQPMLSIDEIYIAGKMRMDELVTSEFPISEIVVRRATLRAVHQADGKWNVKALMPLPDFGDQSPGVRIEDATLMMEDATRPAVVQKFGGIDLTLSPANKKAVTAAATNSFHVDGTARGLPARELRFTGQLGVTDGVLDLTLVIGGLEVSSELIAALPGAPASELRGTELSGRVDATVQVARSATDAPLRWSADVNLDRGRLKHPMLSEPFTEMKLSCRAAPDRLLVNRLDAKYGRATVVLAADRVGWSDQAPIAVAAKVVGMQLDDPSLAQLPESLARVWQRFRPMGTVDAELRITFDGRVWHPQLSANCRGVSLTDREKFPYVLEQSTGLVEYRPSHAGAPDELRLNLTGIGGGRPIRIDAELKHLAPGEQEGVTTETDVALEEAMVPAGQRVAGYRNGPGPGRNPSTRRHPTGWVEITGSDVPLHEELIAALPEKGESFVRSLRPQGALDFRFRAEWKELSQPRANVTQDIRLKNCTIQYAPFPFPLRDVQGLVTCHDWRWTIHDVAARGGNDAAIVVCRGDVTPSKQGWLGDLTFDATNIPLDDNLKLALSSAGQQAWEELKPQGRVNFNAHITRNADLDQPQVDIVLRPCERCVSVEMVKFPYRLEELEGVAVYKAGRIELRDVLGRHGREVYSAANGTWNATPSGGWQFSLGGFNADRLTPHRELISALPPQLQSAIERLQPRGTFGIYNSSLTFEKPPNSERIAAAWDVNLDCHQAVFRGGLPLQSVTGGIRLMGRDTEQSSFSAGELELDSLVLKDVQLTHVRGPLWVDASHCFLGEQATQKLGQPARRITADAYGGSLAANVEITHDNGPNYKLDLALGGGSLARFANERLGGPTDMNGTVSGRLLLSGSGQSLQTLDGSGELRVVDANIYELPVLVSMLKVLRNRTPNTTAFNRCDMKFTIEGEQIHFQQLNLLGDAVSLYGKGETGYDRRLDLVFYALLEPTNLPIPILKTIAGQVSQQALQLNVVGTWEDADVRPETLPGMNQVWEQIQAEFQQGAATSTPATATRDATPAPR